MEILYNNFYICAILNIERVGVDILYNRIQRDEVASSDEVSRTE